MGLRLYGAPIPAVSVDQLQDKLLSRYPIGTDKVVRRPKTNADGSEIDLQFGPQICEQWIKRVYKEIRVRRREQLNITVFCGSFVVLRCSSMSKSDNSSTAGFIFNDSPCSLPLSPLQ